jgi:hypothetical protein
MIFLSQPFRCGGMKKAFPNLVTGNEQDLTPCYPQKNGITGKKLDYWFHLQP